MCRDGHDAMYSTYDMVIDFALSTQTRWERIEDKNLL